MENKIFRQKYLNDMQKKQHLKVKNSLLKLDKRCMEEKDWQLKEIEIKIKREIEELLL